MTVLTYLLGGGNSFSSGGPGKGMHRLVATEQSLSQYYHMASMHAHESACVA